MPTAIQRHRHQAFQTQSQRCFYCGAPMWETDPSKFAAHFRLSIAEAGHFRCTAEHLVARKDGGKNIGANISAACLFCNRTRHRAANALPSEQFQKKVRQRLKQGKWHPPHILLALHMGISNRPSEE
ncbi:HNH endonuclease [Chitiniphilus eburneus]|uniref:HNH domain-containing protein n=1 Tax=Chitiniphilus eburneus TaxID=2571148 RepID=A0A4U0QJR9_9NEIS|nr:HNH endonuclease [Chitiniphilus eburneus]TJZ76314.1 hypothetical protein FAZ21_05940 [Chitiniphilus eburneus]